MSSPEIIEIVKEYKNVMKEMDAIKNEIKKMRDKYKPRITKLTTEKEKFEKLILEYLDKGNDPGLKFQDVVIYKEPKKVYQQKHDRNERISQLLAKYNVMDKTVVDEVLHLAKREKVVSKDSYTLKLKTTTK